MSANFPRGKPRMPFWGLPLLAMMFALILHAIWLVIPQPRLPQMEPGKAVRLIAYSNLDSHVWSPTLFSLPSSLGFSGVMKQRSSNVVPPLKTPVEVTLVYDFKPGDFFISREIVLPENLERFESASLGIAQPSASEPNESRWVLRNMQGDIRMELTRQPPPVVSGTSVVMTGVVEFDAAGQVNSLIVDPSAPPEPWRSEMVHSLRRARISRGLGPVTIRFRFGYERGGGEA